MSKLFVSAATHKGHTRDGNEDSFLVNHRIGGGDFDEFTTELVVSSDAIVLAIADGLGGHEAGEIASRYAVSHIQAQISAVDFGDDVSVSKLMEEISLGLRQQMLATPKLLGMGTTIVMAIVTAESLIFVNVGDSRGYLIDESGLHQATLDDVPNSRSSASRRSGAITQALGGMSSRAVITPHILRRKPPGEEWCLILCSDGVSDSLRPDEIAEVGRSSGADAMTLVEHSLQAGGEDNISAIVVRSRKRIQLAGALDG